eukprot:gnl/Chilomastix_cuspidata/1935.p1 GENE.gnl/Chilomastix_cuspidata/1935~~gnl/Chilomastix_cuspidata/1935.p1  ORF type:complete len:1332 (+),score=591.70 gnl/Chilomastix_cuspidata/1935:1772-5767(+)
MLSLQRFEALAVQKYTNPNPALRTSASNDLTQFFFTSMNALSNCCDILHKAIQESKNPFAHLETSHVIKEFWNMKALTDDQEEEFASVIISTILSRYFDLPVESQTILRELIPFTLFKHPEPWAPALIDRILQPFSQDKMPAPQEIALARALIEVPPGLAPGDSEVGKNDTRLSTFGLVSVRKSILKILEFARQIIVNCVKVTEGPDRSLIVSVNSEMNRDTLDQIAALLVAAAETSKRFKRKSMLFKFAKQTGHSLTLNLSSPSAWDVAFVRLFHNQDNDMMSTMSDTTPSADSLVRLSAGLSIAYTQEFAKTQDDVLSEPLANTLLFLENALDAGLPTNDPERGLFDFMSGVVGILNTMCANSESAYTPGGDASQFAEDPGYLLFARTCPQAVHTLCVLISKVTELSSGRNFGFVDRELFNRLLFRAATLVTTLLNYHETITLWQSAMSAFSSIIRISGGLVHYRISKQIASQMRGPPHAMKAMGDMGQPPSSFQSFPGAKGPSSSPSFENEDMFSEMIVQISAHVVDLFIRSYGTHISDAYANAELSETNPDLAALDESVRSPLIEDCCPPSFWHILKVLPTEELEKFGQAASPLADEISAVDDGVDLRGDERFIRSVASLAWLMAILSVVLVLDTPLNDHFRACCVRLTFSTCLSSTKARQALGPKSPSVKYLETTIISTLRAISVHHLFVTSPSKEFVQDLAQQLGIPFPQERKEEDFENRLAYMKERISEELDDAAFTEEANPERSGENMKSSPTDSKAPFPSTQVDAFSPFDMNRKQFNELLDALLKKCAEMISMKLMSNIDYYRASALQSHSIKLLHNLLNNVRAVDYLASSSTLKNLTQAGPVVALASVIENPNPTPRARRLAKGVSTAIAVVLCSKEGESQLISFLQVYYSVLSQKPPDTATPSDVSEYLASILRVFYALRGICPPIMKQPPLAFGFVKFLNFSMPHISRILNTYASSVMVTTAILRFFGTLYKMGVGIIVSGKSEFSRILSTERLASAVPGFLHAQETRTNFVIGTLRSQLLFVRNLRVGLGETGMAVNSASYATIAKPLGLAGKICRLLIGMKDFNMSLFAHPLRTTDEIVPEEVPNENLLFAYLREFLRLLLVIDIGDLLAFPKLSNQTLNLVASIFAAFPNLLLALDLETVQFVWKLGTEALRSNDEATSVLGGRVILPVLTFFKMAKQSELAQREGRFVEFWFSSPIALSQRELPMVKGVLDASMSLLPPIANVGTELVSQMISTASYKFTRSLSPVVLTVAQILGKNFIPVLQSQMSMILQEDSTTAIRDLELVLETCDSQDVLAKDVLLFSDEVFRLAKRMGRD